MNEENAAREIPEQLDMLSDVIHKQRELVVQLAGRLNDVCRDEPDADRASAPDPVLCPLAFSLRELSQYAQGTLDQLVDILRRIEL